MSGIFGIVLTILAWSTTMPVQKDVFVAAAIVCLIVSSFNIWLDERTNRLRLEATTGPNLLIRLRKTAPVFNTICVVNESDETALKIAFEKTKIEGITIDVDPYQLPFVLARETQNWRGSLHRLVGDDGGGESMPISDYVFHTLEDFEVCLSFENVNGVKYRRPFTLRASLSTSEILCYPHVREIVTTKA